MPVQSLLLLAGLGLILVAAEFFTNGIEEFGRHFSFSQAVVGSIFAAVGTALPETILPCVAIFMYGGASAKEIGVGAILGAPFMLSTLAFFLVGITVTISALRKRRRFVLLAETHTVSRDLTFFLFMYSAAIVVPIAAGKAMRIPVSLVLFAGYIAYAYMTFRGESAEMEHSEGMYFWRALRRRNSISRGHHPPLFLILLQIVCALTVMIKGAHMFVHSLEHVSAALGMDPLLFSLLLAPVATELPEKFNSITWTWKGRDTLALGNITGAMVFQSTFPVSIGLLFTDWRITGMALFSAVLAIASALTVLGMIHVQKRVSPIAMLVGGTLYLLYAAVLLLR
jgi:cation:H+ antiporter